MTDDSPIASSVLAIGSIKWREAKPFNAKDLRRLQAQRQEVPGSQPDTPLLALSRCGSEVDGVACFSPEDLLKAYPESRQLLPTHVSASGPANLAPSTSPRREIA